MIRAGLFAFLKILNLKLLLILILFRASSIFFSYMALSVCLALGISSMGMLIGENLTVADLGSRDTGDRLDLSDPVAIIISHIC